MEKENKLILDSSNTYARLRSGRDGVGQRQKGKKKGKKGKKGKKRAKKGKKKGQKSKANGAALLIYAVYLCSADLPCPHAIAARPSWRRSAARQQHSAAHGSARQPHYSRQSQTHNSRTRRLRHKWRSCRSAVTPCRHRWACNSVACGLCFPALLDLLRPL